jgi:hypothetical protein
LQSASFFFFFFFFFFRKALFFSKEANQEEEKSPSDIRRRHCHGNSTTLGERDWRSLLPASTTKTRKGQQDDTNCLHLSTL